MKLNLLNYQPLKDELSNILENQKISKKKHRATKWSTKAGQFSTSKKCKVTFTLPACHEHKGIHWNCYAIDSDP